MVKTENDDAEKNGAGKPMPISIRLESRLRYMADLAAREQRRSLTTFIEAAIQRELRHTPLEDTHNQKYRTFWEAMPILWDDNEAERLARLALHHPNLLEHKERLIWKVILETNAFWRGTFDKNGEFKKMPPSEAAIRFPKLREHWEVIQKVANGQLPSSALPVAEQKASKKEKRNG